MRKKGLKRLISSVMCAVMVVTGTVSTNAVNVTNTEAAEVNNLETASVSSYVVGKDTLPFTEKEIYNQLFDINNIVGINIDISNSEIKKLQSDFEKNENSPIYRMADVKITITIPSKGTYEYLINEVGIRLKGNTTRKDLYDESKGIYNLDHFKLSFQETFDKTDDGYSNGEYYINSDGSTKWNDTDRKARKKRTFGNMEKMDVKWNSNLDSTYLREYYAYEVFRSEGICAPHIGLTTMQMNVTDKTANSAYLGVYTIHEAVDSAFIKNNLLDETNNYIINANGDYTDGDLYKSGWAPGDGYNNNWRGADLNKSCTYGISDDLTGYKVNYDLKTNKKKSDKSPIKNLLNGLSNVSSKSDLSEYVDMDYFVKFAAVAYAVGNGDDMRNNYNNYYLYFYTDNSDGGKQKMIVIPYDYDRCFGITNGYNPDGTGMSNMDPYSTSGAAVGSQNNPLYRYSVDKGGFYVSEYTEALKQVYNNELLNIEEFEKVYNIAKKNYGDKVTPSKEFENKLNSNSGTRVTKEHFYFTIDTDNDAKNLNTTSGSTTDKNMIISEYLKRMKSTLGNAINASSDVSAAECYVRGEFSDWQTNNAYKMSYNKASGLQSFKLELSGTKQFKIYNSTADAWYGYDNIKGNVPSGISAGDNSGNISAQAGTYYIIYNPSTNEIQISDAEIPTETTTEKPTQTPTQRPTQPTTDEPTQPPTDEPTQPSTDEPTQPSTDEPTEPSTEEPSTTAEKVKVTFNANGGKVSGKSSYSVNVKYGTALKSIKTAKRSKYTFLGWYTKKNGGSKLKQTTKYKKNTTYYARWKKVTVSQAAVSGLKNSASGKMSVVLKKISGAGGYELVYSTDPKFKSAKKVSISSTTKTLSKLKKGKTYYVKARAYKKDSNGTKIYGKYSSVKKIKIKK